VVYLDSNAFISYFEGTDSDSAVLKKLFEARHAKPGSGVTSEITLAEVLAGSHKSGPQMKRSYLDLIVWSKSFNLVPVDRQLIYQSAELCGVHKQMMGRKLGLIDAIHLATAYRAECRFFVSADKGILPPASITKVGFEPLAIDEIQKALE
jgi:predicted nucleic acid-binding protein